MLPFAADASLTCQYFTQGPWRNHPSDPYAANWLPSAGAGAAFGRAIRVAPDCGRPGRACCPSPYHQAFNPAPPGFLCWGGQQLGQGAYCDGATSER